MTVFTAKQFEDGRPPIAPEHSGYTVAKYAEVTVPNTLALNDIIRLMKIPPKSVIIGGWIHCDAIDTNSALQLRLAIEEWPTNTHIMKLTVTTAPNATESAVVTVDGVDHDVALGNGDSKSVAAGKIADVIDALEGYSAAAEGAVVTVTGTSGTALTLAYNGADTNSEGTVSGPEDIVAGSELTAEAYPVSGEIAHLTSFPASILQNADNLLTERRIVAKVTVEGTTRVEGKIRATIRYRAADFGL